MGFRHDCCLCEKDKHVLSACDHRFLFRPGITLFTSAWLLILALSLTLKLFGFIMCFDMVVKILTGWQSSRSWLYILATVKQMCLKWFYASGYSPFFPPHKIILKPTFPVLGTSLSPSACCAEQVRPRIAFALGLQPGCMETQDISANTASGSMGEEME